MTPKTPRQSPGRWESNLWVTVLMVGRIEEIGQNVPGWSRVGKVVEVQATPLATQEHSA